MGWDFAQGATRKDIIQERIADKRGTDGSIWQCLRHTTRGNVLWTVWEVAKTDGSVERFIGCDLLKNSSWGWGYKDQCESMHPYYYTCPLIYLDLVPVACEDWREKVRQYHAKQKRKFQVGQVVELEDSTIPYVTITSARPLLGRYNGKTYRIPKRMIAA